MHLSVEIRAERVNHYFKNSLLAYLDYFLFSKDVSYASQFRYNLIEFWQKST